MTSLPRLAGVQMAISFHTVVKHTVVAGSGADGAASSAQADGTLCRAHIVLLVNTPPFNVSAATGL